MQPALSTREAARIELIHNVVSDGVGLERAFLAAARLSAQTLGAARVGIWYFTDDERCIDCQYLYDARTDQAQPRERIDLSLCNAYAQALRAHRMIAADDALGDPRTRELHEYLGRYGITSLMDCPIYEQGRAIGVLCHEHIGARRTWTKEEAAFGGTVADMLGVYIEQDRARRHYEALLSARRELEQARVMESVGRMAAGVAHDFNNVLSALRMASDVLRLTVSPTREVLDARVADLQTLIKQGARLVKQLLDVARQQPSDEVCDLVEVARSMESFLRTLEVDGVRSTLVTYVPHARVRLARARLEQVLTNLAVNARDAMIGGGALTIEIGEVATDDEEGGSHYLAVRDTGVGMDEHTCQRMFEPYFTTKGANKGLGLGLATVYRIVEDSGGHIQIETAPGAGTLFRIRWPRA